MRLQVTVYFQVSGCDLYSTDQKSRLWESGMTHKISNQIMIKMCHCLFSMIRASLFVYHVSYVIDLSSERYIVSTGHRYSWYQQRRYSEDTNGET